MMSRVETSQNNVFPRLCRLEMGTECPVATHPLIFYYAHAGSSEY